MKAAWFYCKRLQKYGALNYVQFFFWTTLYDGVQELQRLPLAEMQQIVHISHCVCLPISLPSTPNGIITDQTLM